MQSTISFLITIFIYAAFGIAAIVWMAKRKKAGKAVAVWVRILIILIVLSSGVSIFTYFISSPPSEPTTFSEQIFYVKSGGANVRECPSTSCKILETLAPNTKLTFPGDLFDKHPDWAEITFQDGKLGYVSKTTLSSESSIESPPQGDGIALGSGNFELLIVGYSYGFSFCIPESARSGATCGGLAGATQSPVGGSPPYSLMKGSGFFPPGMSLELNGLLSGSPTTPGTYNFQICAKDLSMNRGCQNYTLVVKKEASVATPPPVTETTEFAKIESAVCQNMGYSMPGNPNSWIIRRVTVRGTGGGYGLSFSCDSRYGGGPCHNQSLTCDSWTVKNAGNCNREAGQPETTEWTYWAEGSINTDIGFNFAVNATGDWDDAVKMNISCN